MTALWEKCIHIYIYFFWDEQITLLRCMNQPLHKKKKNDRLYEPLQTYLHMSYIKH